MMKKISFLPLVALVLAVAASAFTSQQKIGTNPQWFFKGTTTAGMNDRLNYEALSGQDGDCPGNSAVYCVIEAPAHLDSNNQPDGTPDLSGSVTVISRKP